MTNDEYEIDIELKLFHDSEEEVFVAYSPEYKLAEVGITEEDAGDKLSCSINCFIDKIMQKSH